MLTARQEHEWMGWYELMIRVTLWEIRPQTNTHSFFFCFFFFFLPRDYNAVIALIKDSNVMVVRGIVTSIVTTTTVGGITFVCLCVRV